MTFTLILPNEIVLIDANTICLEAVIDVNTIDLQSENEITLIDMNTIGFGEVNGIKLSTFEKFEFNKQSTILGGSDNLKRVGGRDTVKKVGGSGGLS